MGIQSRPTPTRTAYRLVQVQDGTVLYKALNPQVAEAFKAGWAAAGGAETKIETSIEPKRRRV